MDYIRSAETEGARMIYRGESPAPFDGGFYVSPVIFDRVLPQQRIFQEEIFGPVLSMTAFHDENEAIRLANATRYGLSAILWTKDLGRAHRVIQQLQAGWITVNATERPVGGPAEGVISVGGHKASGIGTEGGVEGLAAYTTSSAVQIFV